MFKRWKVSFCACIEALTLNFSYCLICHVTKQAVSFIHVTDCDYYCVIINSCSTREGSAVHKDSDSLKHHFQKALQKHKMTKPIANMLLLLLLLLLRLPTVMIMMMEDEEWVHSILANVHCRTCAVAIVTIAATTIKFAQMWTLALYLMVCRLLHLNPVEIL